MSVISDGSYDIPEGLVCSVPVTCRNFEYKIVEGIEMDDFSKEQLKIAIDELIEEKDEIHDDVEVGIWIRYFVKYELKNKNLLYTIDNIINSNEWMIFLFKPKNLIMILKYSISWMSVVVLP